MAMTTEEFWEQAATENGIEDAPTIKEAHRRALQDLNEEFSTSNFEI